MTATQTAVQVQTGQAFDLAGQLAIVAAGLFVLQVGSVMLKAPLSDPSFPTTLKAVAIGIARLVPGSVLCFVAINLLYRASKSLLGG